jgi:P4 family phage/plasmid primase-like protien
MESGDEAGGGGIVIEFALAYARRGWAVHPLRPSDKTPITRHGCKDATTDEATIRRWWQQWPAANIGLATGHGFFVVDIDPAGMEWLEANELPTTHEAVTGRGGRHLLYRLSEGVIIANSAGKISEGVDIRGIGGYIVAPPSLHPNGNTYTWLDVDGDIPEGPCSDAPLWLVDMAAKVADTGATGRFALPAVIEEGGRDNTLYKLAASLRAQEFGEAEIRAALDAANMRCSPPLLARDLDRIAKSIMTKPAGRSAAYQRPQLPAPSPVPAVSDVIDAEWTEETGDAGGVKLTVSAAADAVLSRHRVLNVDGYLYEYSGTHWEHISADRLKALAMQQDGDMHTSLKRRNEIADHIRVKTHRNRQEWRSLQPWEVPVGNGVVDIRSMTLRPHRPEDYLQACVPVPYEPTAQADELMRCLDTYFGKDDDAESKVDALQEFVGYCLMPHARYKKALLCVGESDSGKSTIPFLLRTLFGPSNVCSVGVEDMDDSRARAPLLGKLVNLLTELTSDAMIADGGFKTLVSTEEPIAFDPKFLPPVMDVPVCKHVIVTNVLPTINDRSRGTFNRLLVLRFNHVIPKAEQDTEIWDRLRKQIDGILLWGLYGAQRLYLNAGRFTQAGVAEVEEYRAAQNPVVEWIGEACEIDPDGRALLSDMRERYSRWAGKPVSPQWFAACLQSAGYQTSRNPVHVGAKKGRICSGLRLL